MATKIIQFNKSRFNGIGVKLSSLPLPPTINRKVPSHKNQILPLKNRVVPVDSSTAFLAHYDLNENDVLTGIAPVGYRYAYANGAGKYIQTQLRSDQLTSITIEAWANITDTTGVQTVVSSFEAAGVGIEYGAIAAGKFSFPVYTAGSYKIAYADSATPAGWVHVAGTYDGSTVRIYINGVLQAVTVPRTGPIATSTQSIHIGSNPPGASNPWKGYISDLRIWNYARSTEEIKRYMNASIDPNSEGLIGYWKLDEGSGIVANDLSANSNDGILIGKGSWVDGRSVYTLIKDGAFGGAIAIDEATENVVTTRLIEPYEPYHTMTRNGLNLTFTAKESPYATVIKIATLGVLQGRTFAYRGYMKKNNVPWIYPHPNINSYNQRSSALKKYFDPVTGYFEVVEHFNSTSNWLMYSNYQNQVAQGDVITIENFQIEEKSFSTTVIDGQRSAGILEYPIEVMNDEEGTLSFWAKLPYELPFSQTNQHLFVSTADSYSSSKSLNLCKYAVDYPDRLVGVHWASTDGVVNHVTIERTQVSDYNNKGWNMYTFTWKNPNGYVVYMNGKKVGEAGAGKILRAFDSNKLSFKNLMMDELRIDKKQKSPDEILSWYHSNSPFWPRGIYTVGY